MTTHSFSVDELSPTDLDLYVGDLSRVLVDSVADGASISFMAPLDKTEAEQFWRVDVRSGVENGTRLLFGALVGDQLIGTVQLILGMPPNQPHRAEVSKMIVHPESRRLGVGRALMTTVIQAARRANKTLVTLDTRTGDVSEALYTSVGFEQAGVIPDFAYDPYRQSRHATTYMFMHL
ncbi:MAG: GNAT family N-acetyltransferase [Cyanobacteria bacterium J06626_14]